MKKLTIYIILTISINSLYGQASLKSTCLDSTVYQIKESIAYYQGRLSVDSLDQISYNKIGMGYFKLKEYTTAITYFDKLISLNPEYTVALANRGICKLLANQVDGAYDDFSLSIKMGQDPQILNGQTLSEWLRETSRK